MIVPLPHTPLCLAPPFIAPYLTLPDGLVIRIWHSQTPHFTKSSLSLSNTYPELLTLQIPLNLSTVLFCFVFLSTPHVMF